MQYLATSENTWGLVLRGCRMAEPVQCVISKCNQKHFCILNLQFLKQFSVGYGIALRTTSACKQAHGAAQIQFLIKM